jgi:predicted amidohydrolase
VNPIALGVHRVHADRAANLAAIADLAHAASGRGAALVLFAETALTGFVATGEPAHDLPLGEPVPGPATDALAHVARDVRLWIGLGLYEREGGRLYDAAVLLSPDGGVALHYRRIDPHWHRPGNDTAVYRQGAAIPAVETPFGRCAFLLCGDLFNDAVLTKLAATPAEVLLVPFARGFDSEVADAADWERRERFRYAGRVRRAGLPALLVNSFGRGCFGGALAVDAQGATLDRLPPGRSGLLLVELGGPG